ncbi:MAG TPA: hypothetical protein VF282_08580 [Bacillota bacterium]
MIPQVVGAGRPRLEREEHVQPPGMGLDPFFGRDPVVDEEKVRPFISAVLDPVILEGTGASCPVDLEPRQPAGAAGVRRRVPPGRRRQANIPGIDKQWQQGI